MLEFVMVMLVTCSINLSVNSIEFDIYLTEIENNVNEIYYDYKKEKVVALILPHIKQHEGFSAVPYADLVKSDNSIIGYGKNITNNKNINYITEKQASKLLEKDVNKLYIEMCKYEWFKDLDIHRQAAILDLSYNMGTHWVNKFPTVIKYIKEGDFEKAAFYLVEKDNGNKTLYRKQVGKRAIVISYTLANGKLIDHQSIKELNLV